MRFLVTTPHKFVEQAYKRTFRGVDSEPYMWVVKHGTPDIEKMPPRTVWITTNMSHRPKIIRRDQYVIISVPLDAGERPYHAFTAALSLLDGIKDKQRVDWVLVSYIANNKYAVTDVKNAYLRYLAEHKEKFR